MIWAQSIPERAWYQAETVYSNNQRAVKAKQWRPQISPNIQKTGFDTICHPGVIEINT